MLTNFKPFNGRKIIMTLLNVIVDQANTNTIFLKFDWQIVLSVYALFILDFPT